MSAPNQSENRELILQKTVSNCEPDQIGRFRRSESLLSLSDQDRSLHPGSEIFGHRNSESFALNQWQQLALCSTAAARSYLPYETARRFNALPIAVIGGTGTGGFEDPVISMLLPEQPDPETVKSLRFVCGLEIIFDTAPQKLIEKALDAAYLGADTELVSRLNIANSEIKPASSGLNCNEKIGGAIPELLDSLLHQALLRRASDIHIEPSNQAGPGGDLVIRMRIDGRLRAADGFILSAEIGQAIFRRIKILASLDTTALRVPLDGSMTFRLGRQAAGEAVRMRVSFVPLVQGEKLVLRILENQLLEDAAAAQSRGSAAKDSLLPFSLAGMTPEQEQIFRCVLAGDRGAVLLSGPTGSGKSTLLSLALQILQGPHRTIVAIEDPVERCLPNVTHLEIDRPRGLDYRQLLISVLRQDPDVLMLGEIREAATAAAALDAALTGKLVLSTIHAASVFEVLFRLLEMGLSAELLSIGLRCLSSQRLVPLLCPECRTVRAAGAGLQRIFGLKPGQEVAAACGCQRCNFTGNAGRTGVYEILPISERIRDSICGIGPQQTRSITRLQRMLQLAAYDEGYRPLVVGIRRLLLDGLVSSDGALEAAGLNGVLIG